MFFINFSTLWSFSYFFCYIYIIVVFSIILYILPSIKDLINYNKFKNNNNSFDYLTGFDLYWLFLSPLVLFLIINFSWSSYSLSSWFGNLIFTSFQYKIGYFILFFYTIIVTAYSTSFYFSSKEVYDYKITCFNFFFWIVFLFSSNSIFTVIFFIEILSTLIMLILISSSFSTTYFYNNLNLNTHNYFNNTTPFFFVQTLMYFFWISLISSLNLFFFLILFYIKFLTFDWFFFEFVFFYIINLNNIKDFFFIFFIWFNFIFSIFLKCGLVPFYFWKPIFFKGIPNHALFFYIIFFYFFILLFFLYFFLVYLNEIFYFFISVNIGLLLIGFFILLFIICEAYYIKAFLAMSSIINTLFVFLALNGLNIVDFIFFL
jgi:hypothetical protein